MVVNKKPFFSDQASYPVGTMSSTTASRRGSVASFADQYNFGASSMSAMPNYFYSGATLAPPPQSMQQQANVTYHVPGAYSGEKAAGITPMLYRQGRKKQEVLP